MTRPAGIPDLAAALHADEQLDLVEVLGEVPAHQHEPGILRDTVRCPACARTQLDLPEVVLGKLVKAAD